MSISGQSEPAQSKKSDVGASTNLGVCARGRIGRVGLVGTGRRLDGIDKSVGTANGKC